MHQETVNAYNKGAGVYAQKFAGVGPKINDINRAFEAFTGNNPHVLELGCGDGRDALEICKRTTNYSGFGWPDIMLKKI